MTWLAYVLTGAGTGFTPIGTATSDIVSYILSFGVLGIGVILYQLGLIVPKATMTKAVDAARTDLLDELVRVRAEKVKAEEQRDEALRIAQVQIVPLLTSFTATSSALLPLLQEAVRYREGRRDLPPERESQR